MANANSRHTQRWVCNEPNMKRIPSTLALIASHVGAGVGQLHAQTPGQSGVCTLTFGDGAHGLFHSEQYKNSTLTDSDPDTFTVSQVTP